eukprot:scaffold672773_cov47-Prasinocladus_malaysianus.AAC.2
MSGKTAEPASMVTSDLRYVPGGWKMVTVGASIFLRMTEADAVPLSRTKLVASTWKVQSRTENLEISSNRAALDAPCIGQRPATPAAAGTCRHNEVVAEANRAWGSDHCRGRRAQKVDWKLDDLLRGGWQGVLVGVEHCVGLDGHDGGGLGPSQLEGGVGPNVCSDYGLGFIAVALCSLTQGCRTSLRQELAAVAVADATTVGGLAEDSAAPPEAPGAGPAPQAQ